MRTERQETVRLPATERARERLGPGGRGRGRRRNGVPGNGAARHGLQPRGLAHGFPTIHAVMRAGVIVAAAVGAGGHFRRRSTGREVVCQSIRQIDALKDPMLACAPVRLVVVMVVLVFASACASARSRVVPVPVPASVGASLHVNVVYPAPTDTIAARDSSFLFGAVAGGAGRRSLTVNGAPVPVLPNGAWIAWVPLPDDTVAAFRDRKSTRLNSTHHYNSYS